MAAVAWRQYREIDDATEGGKGGWHGKKLVHLARSSSRWPAFSSRSLLHNRRRAGVGEATRGCRLDADNAGGVSFVQSSMTLLSCVAFSFRLPLRERLTGREEEGLRRALHPPHRITERFYRSPSRDRLIESNDVYLHLDIAYLSNSKFLWRILLQLDVIRLTTEIIWRLWKISKIYICVFEWCYRNF